MKLESSQPAEEKCDYKVVRTDSYTDIPGEIISADETTGECSMCIAGEPKTFSLGTHGIKIVPRAKRSS